MKSKFFLILGFVVAAFCGLTSCEKDNELKLPDEDITPGHEGLFVLCQGQYYNGIEGSLNVIDYKSEKSQLNIFRSANDRYLGGTPQCGIVYGSKIYIGVYESNTIEIIEKSDYKSVKQINLNNETGTQPRNMIAAGGNIYISMFDGYVARLDTTTLQINAKIKVGANPEIMTLYNNKLYVPNSDGMSYPDPMGKTASEIDLKSFTVTRTFEVPENPSRFYASADKGLYLLCMGNYSDVNAALYKINPDFSYSYIDDATLAEICDDWLYYVNEPFYSTGEPVYRRFNLKSGEISDWSIEKPEYATGIYYDIVEERICISSLRYYGGIWPSYELPGYVAVYDKEGNHLRDYEVGVGPAWLF